MNIDFNQSNGLVPVIIQHSVSLQVLMLGYMNQEALAKTQQEGKVTFFSRSKNRLWTKGETSGNYLYVSEILQDCDKDTLLIKAIPNGPTCHKGSFSCFGDQREKGFLYLLEETIAERISAKDGSSYTNRLYESGINKVAQKVGEEAVELIIEAMDHNAENFKNEAADLLYHFLILLKTKSTKLEEIEEVLVSRSPK